MAVKRAYAEYAQGQNAQYYGGPQKRIQVNRDIHGLAVGALETLEDGSDQILNEQYLGCDDISSLAISPDGSALNNCPPQFSIVRRQSQPSNATQPDEAQIDAIAERLASRMHGHLGHFDHNKSQSPFTELDLQEPWNAIDMGIDNACRSTLDPLQTQYYQRGQRPASFQTVHQARCQNQSQRVNQTNRPCSDSGYGTFGNKSPGLQSTTQSIFSGEPLATIQDYTSLTDNMNDVSFQSPHEIDFDQLTEYEQNLPLSDIKQPVPFEGLIIQPPENGPFICEICLQQVDLEAATLKNKSEWKKHMLRHTKPFVCHYPNCKRGTSGFSTHNDLDRHRKSVHQMLPLKGATDRTYICAAPNCSKREKIWPRADNFKQHCERLHRKQGWDVDELMNRSWERARNHHTSVNGHGRPRKCSLPVEAVFPITSAHSTSTCQTAHSPQNVCYHHMENVQESATVPPIVLSINSCPIPNNMEVYEEPVHAQLAGRADAARLIQETRALDSSMEAPQCRYKKDTSPDHHLIRDNTTPMNSLTQIQRPRIPDPGGRTRRSCRRTTPPKHPVTHHADPDTRSDLPQGAATQKGNKPDVQDRTRVPDHRDASDLASDLASDQTAKDRTKPEAVSQSRIEELLKDVKMETGDSSDEKLTETLEAIVADRKSKLSKSDSNLDEMEVKSKVVDEAMFEDHVMLEKPCHKCPHPGCGKHKPSASDLTKHMKRHTRPYGCTYPKCYKRFGSKNDWKRHENTMHFQAECWRCDEQATTGTLQLQSSSHSKAAAYVQSSGGRTNDDLGVETTVAVKERDFLTQKACATVSYLKEDFKNHLRDAHQITLKADIKKRKNACHIGHNGQGAFWCGFCKQILELKKRGSEAWDEKFDHIDEHYKNHDDIRNWVEMDNKIKGEKDEEEGTNSHIPSTAAKGAGDMDNDGEDDDDETDADSDDESHASNDNEEPTIVHPMMDDFGPDLQSRHSSKVQDHPDDILGAQFANAMSSFPASYCSFDLGGVAFTEEVRVPDDEWAEVVHSTIEPSSSSTSPTNSAPSLPEVGDQCEMQDSGLSQRQHALLGLPIGQEGCDVFEPALAVGSIARRPMEGSIIRTSQPTKNRRKTDDHLPKEDVTTRRPKSIKTWVCCRCLGDESHSHCGICQHLKCPDCGKGRGIPKLELELVEKIHEQEGAGAEMVADAKAESVELEWKSPCIMGSQS